MEIPVRFNSSANVEFDLEPRNLLEAEQFLNLYGYEKLVNSFGPTESERDHLSILLKHTSHILLQRQAEPYNLNVTNEFPGIRSLIFVRELGLTQKIVASEVLPLEWDNKSRKYVINNDLNSLNTDIYPKGFYMAIFKESSEVDFEA